MIEFHPATRRNDGFYKMVYQFQSHLQKGKSIEATVQKYHPTDHFSLNDFLEIRILSEQEAIELKLAVKSKSLFHTRLLPGFIKKIFWLLISSKVVTLNPKKKVS